MEMPHFKWPHVNKPQVNRPHVDRPRVDSPRVDSQDSDGAPFWSLFKLERRPPHTYSHGWVARQPYWTIGAIAGFAAGGILMLVELAFSAATGADAWRTPRLVATMLMGDPALQGIGYSLPVLAAALAVHYLLGAWFGLVMAALLAPFRLDSSYGMAVLAGAVFGALLYLFNFYLMASVLPWFVELRGWTTVLGHVVFGMAAALIYRMLELPAHSWLRRKRASITSTAQGESTKPDASGRNDQPH